MFNKYLIKSKGRYLNIDKKLAIKFKDESKVDNIKTMIVSNLKHILNLVVNKENILWN